MNIEVRGSLGALSGAWDALVDAAPIASPFLRSWWLEATGGPEPRFVLVMDGDELVGGVALEEDSVLGVPRLREMGATLGADHLDLVAAPGRTEAVVAQLADWFASRQPLLVDLSGLTEDARVGRVLPGRVRRDRLDDAPYTPLPPTLEEYLAERPKEFRNMVARPRKRLERAGVEHRVAAPADCGRVVAELRRLHEAQFGGDSEFLPAFERFALAAPIGVERGELMLHELIVDGRAIAIDVCFEVGGRLSLYQGGRDSDYAWRGCGTYLMLLSVEHAYKRACHEFDLLRGEEAYKEIWASKTRGLVRLQAANGARARAVNAVLPLAAGLRRTFRR
jgi:CelD/BcsL family acetyltransferase involved in cellulose biosynthesis